MQLDKRRKGDLALLSVIFIWGINFAVLKAALGAMHPHVVNLFRFSISTVVLGALYLTSDRPAHHGLFTPLREYGRQIIALGLLGYLFYQLCFIIGMDHTTAGSAALIMASAPLWTATIGYLFGFERLTRRAWGGLVLTLVGTLVIVLGGAKKIDFGNDTFFGNVMMTCAAVLWGGYTAFNRPVSRHVSPTAIAFFGVLTALPFLTAIGLPYLPSVAWQHVDAWVWFAILFSGALSTGLAFVIWNTAIKSTGPSQTAVFGNLVPVVAVVSGAVLLGEAITAVQVAGGTLIIGGVFLTRSTRTLPSKKEV